MSQFCLSGHLWDSAPGCHHQSGVHGRLTTGLGEEEEGEEGEEDGRRVSPLGRGQGLKQVQGWSRVGASLPRSPEQAGGSQHHTPEWSRCQGCPRGRPMAQRC